MNKRYFLLFSIMLILFAISGCSTNEQTKKIKQNKKGVSEKKVELTISAAER